MLLRGTGFVICVILGVFCAIACLAECGRCPLEGVCKPVDCSTCPSRFLNTRSSYLGLDYGLGCHHNVPVLQNVSNHSKLMILKLMVQSLNYLDADSITSVCECPSVILMPKCQMSNTSMQGNMESQSTMSVLYELDDNEPFFPLVSRDIYFAKSVAVKNMIQQP
ncbi:hypothetical protein KSS87_011144, partial [Heliosperma pusillum]